MIGIATITSNSAGAVLINDKRKSEDKKASARINRTKTLDGGVCIVHNGFSHGDRTVSIKATITQTDADALWTIFQDETLVMFSNDEGCFDAYINNLTIDGGQVTIEIYLSAKLSG